MMKLLAVSILAAAIPLMRAEIIDRIAVTVDELVITESDIINHIRVAAFLNREPAELNGETKREAADRLIEQALIRREMIISRYPAPEKEEIAPLLQQVREERFSDEAAFEEGLKTYGITEQALRDSLLMQLTLLRFIEYRFRPGVAISDEEVEELYETEFVLKWKKEEDGSPTPLEDIRDELEEILIGRQVDEALSRWLDQAAEQARIRRREVVFQ